VFCFETRLNEGIDNYYVVPVTLTRLTRHKPEGIVNDPADAVVSDGVKKALCLARSIARLARSTWVTCTFGKAAQYEVASPV
jgi:hypothetical protein